MTARRNYVALRKTLKSRPKLVNVRSYNAVTFRAKKRMKRTFLLLLIVFVVGPVLAQSQFTAKRQGLAIAVKAGTMGPGVEIALPIGRKLVIRAGGSAISASESRTETEDDLSVRLDADVTWGGFSGLIDFHPFANGFRLTGGAYVDNREVTAYGTPVSTYDLDGKIFQPERLGSLSATFKYDQAVSPYLGFGYGDMTRGSRVGFLFDAGVIYAGKPTFEMVGTGMIAQTANWATTMEEGLKTFTWMPVISLGLSFRIL